MGAQTKSRKKKKKMKENQLMTFLKPRSGFGSRNPDLDSGFGFGFGFGVIFIDVDFEDSGWIQGPIGLFLPNSRGMVSKRVKALGSPPSPLIFKPIASTESSSALEDSNSQHRENVIQLNFWIHVVYSVLLVLYNF